MNRMELQSKEPLHWNEQGEEKKMDHINGIVEGDDHIDQGDDEADNDDDDDDSIDINADLKELRRDKSDSSIRRNDSYTSFLTRSERNRLLGKDEAPAVTSQESSKRRIKFHEDTTKLVKTIEIDKIVDDDIKDKYWMTDKDFNRIETDIKMTQFRYENSKSGKIPFDHDKNSIRGLEAFILYVDKRPIEMKLHNHRQSVLKEIHDQKMKHGGSLQSIDWEKVRMTSEKHSISCRNKAVELGIQDEIDHQNAWGIPSTRSTATTSSSNSITVSSNDLNNVLTASKKNPNSNKKKMKNPLLFWKR